MRQLIADERFTNIQRAQAGLTRLFEEARKSMSFFRVMKGDKPLGVLVPNEMWEDFVEDMEAMTSINFQRKIAAARRDKKSYTMEEVKQKLGI